MSEKLEQLKAKLRELFQIDQGDLDFGIYRILNVRRDEIERFLADDLLPQVKEILAEHQPAEIAETREKLAKAVEGAKAAGIDPEQAPSVKQLREELAQGVSVDKLEEEVYSHLATFFGRYYDGGDFMSLRRYKEGVYALPYEGEEVKLHWANADQYYIKSAETLRHYAFKTGKGRVRFELVAASTEHGNVKAAPELERRFILSEGAPVAVETDELVINFEYRPDTKKRKQTELNEFAATALLALPAGAPTTEAISDWTEWRASLAEKMPTKGSPDRTVLDKRLNDFSARHTFDYFIHKDLKTFLSRELDFFIKNEIMFLDDIENESAPRVQQYLSKIKVVRRIAHKIIDFLAQLEDFQKKLWLKKKFVLETNWLVTLDKVPEALYPEIAANEAQRDEWLRLFAIDLSGENGRKKNASNQLTNEFLKLNPSLVLDTAYFDRDFTEKLIGSITNIDGLSGGVLVHGDNFQALNLLKSRFRESTKCIYIDPPYNTDSSAIPYKNNYRHSSWCTMMRDRLSVSRDYLKSDGAIFVSIDKTERTVLEHALDEVFGSNNNIEELIWTQATANSQLPNYSTNHEYVKVYAKDRASVEADKDMFREPKPGFTEVMELATELNASYPPVSVIESELKALYERHKIEYREQIEASGKEWDAEAKRQDPWRGLYPYSRAEYRDQVGKFVAEEDAEKGRARIWIWSEIPTGAPASKQSATTKDPDHSNYRYYKPIHPVTGKPCPHPQAGWKFPLKSDNNNPDRRCFEGLDEDHRIAWGKNEKKVPRTKGFLHEVETNIGTSVFYEYNDGEAELSDLFNQSGMFLSPKSTKFVRRFIAQATKKSDNFMDFFGGSGSSAHALIAQNRLDGGTRKFVTAEVGRHFDTILLPRIKKAMYSDSWSYGNPGKAMGYDQVIKYLRTESYEDCLDNLALEKIESSSRLIEENSSFREGYMLRYMLDVEARNSLLNLDAFVNPFNYTLSVVRDDERKQVIVNLIETFNYLIGLRVKTQRRFDDVYEVIGDDPEGNSVVILWRNAAKMDDDVLAAWFRKRDYEAAGVKFDLLYVNGDNTLETLRGEGETWSVRLIEEAFHARMFEVEEGA